MHEVSFKSWQAEALSVTGEVLGVFLMDDSREIASIVEDHVEGLSTLESSDGLLDAPLVFLLSLALPGEDGHTGSSNAILGSDI